MGRARRLAIVGGIVLAAIGACGGDGEDATERASTTSTEAMTTTAPSAGDPTTTVPACPDVEIPADATDLVEVGADVDGDSQVDALRSYRLGEGWHLQVELHGGGGADLAMDTLGGAGVEVLGGADVDGDGADEVWARTGSGASATIVGSARFTGCTLVRVTLPAGEPADFPVGGSVGTAAGLGCEAAADPAGHLSTYTATNTGERDYSIQVVEHVLEGTVLRELGRRTEQATIGDDLFVRATTFRCGDLSL
jgi:hypothetical protein